jgi:hypothetical protein
MRQWKIDMVLPYLVIDGNLKSRFERREKRGLCSLSNWSGNSSHNLPAFEFLGVG